MSALVVIPARYSSTRFPGKPLAPLKGIPVIRHVYENSLRSHRADGVIVVPITYWPLTEPEILEHYERNPSAVEPETRRNEVLSLIRGGLQDFEGHRVGARQFLQSGKQADGHAHAISRARARASSSAGSARAPSTQASPSSKNSCFQTGAICLTRSMA